MKIAQRMQSLSLSFVLAGCLIPSVGLADTILYENDPANGNINSGTSQSDVGVVQSGTEPNYCATGTCGTPGTGPNQPFIQGDVFTLSSMSTITSATFYLVDDVPTGGPTNAAPSGDTLASEFSNIFLDIGPDGENLSPAGGTKSASEYYLSGGLDYASISDPGTYYAIWQVTFSGLNITLPAGDYDFAVGGVPIGNNTLALLGTDLNPLACTSPCVSQTYGNGYELFQHDGPGGPPILTYYGTPAGYDGSYNIDIDAQINGNVVPEPASFGLVGLGIGGLLFGIRRARRQLERQVEQR